MCTHSLFPRLPSCVCFCGSCGQCSDRVGSHFGNGTKRAAAAVHAQEGGKETRLAFAVHKRWPQAGGGGGGCG